MKEKSFYLPVWRTISVLKFQKSDVRNENKCVPFERGEWDPRYVKKNLIADLKKPLQELN